MYPFQSLHHFFIHSLLILLAVALRTATELANMIKDKTELELTFQRPVVKARVMGLGHFFYIKVVSDIAGVTVIRMFCSDTLKTMCLSCFYHFVCSLFLFVFHVSLFVFCSLCFHVCWLGSNNDKNMKITNGKKM